MNHEASYVVGRVSRDAAKMKKKQNEGEASERASDAEYLTDPINGDIDERGGWRAFLSSAYKHHLEVYLLAASSAPPLSKPRSSPAFCAALFFIPPRSSSRAIALSRENPPSFRAVSLSSLYSLFFSPSRSCAFLKGEGARPGAAVSNKYDTGIGYKETINHSSGRERDLLPRGLLSGKFLRGYLWPDEKKERSRNLPKIVQVPRKPSHERVIRITEAALLSFSRTLCRDTVREIGPPRDACFNEFMNNEKKF